MNRGVFMSNINKKNSNIIIRVDKGSKDFFKKIVEKEGYTTSKVLSAFIDRVCMSEEIPSDIIKKIEYEKIFLITIPYIKKVLEEVIDSMEKDVIDKIYLFGSYARGEETASSDIDLRIVGKNKIS
jgi:antitoxin component of RelBE/YafQ-DinJ toxin-antitoxin module